MLLERKGTFFLFSFLLLLIKPYQFWIKACCSLVLCQSAGDLNLSSSVLHRMALLFCCDEMSSLLQQPKGTAQMLKIGRLKENLIKCIYLCAELSTILFTFACIYFHNSRLCTYNCTFLFFLLHFSECLAQRGKHVIPQTNRCSFFISYPHGYVSG